MGNHRKEINTLVNATSIGKRKSVHDETMRKEKKFDEGEKRIGDRRKDLILQRAIRGLGMFTLLYKDTIPQVGRWGIVQRQTELGNSTSLPSSIH